MSFYLRKTSDYNYLRLDLFLPVLNAKKYEDEINGFNKVVEVSFHTSVKYLSSRVDKNSPPQYRHFLIQILGFGFAVAWQDGY